MAKNNPSVDKGGVAEEALREYFKGLGSFVLRGVPVKEGTETVTDIDLWIYTRSSPMARHITIVDIKNKKRGKAFERAIWLRGLQAAVKADDAVIATQGARDSAFKFADRLQLKVLSSTVFDAIVKKYSADNTRMFFEELESEWREIKLGPQNLASIVELSRLQVSKGLEFSTLNRWADDAVRLLKEVCHREPSFDGPITRAFYYCCALLSIAGDYLGRQHVLSDNDTRKEYFRSGILFGDNDELGAKKFLDFAESVATEFLDQSGAAAAQIRTGFERAAQELPVEGLVEFFSRANAGHELFKAALAFDEATFARRIDKPSNLTAIEAKVVVGLLCDYGGVARSDVFGGSSPSRKKSSEDRVPQGSLPL